MADTPNMGTPPERSAAQFNNIGSVQGSIDIKLPEIDSAARSVGLLVFHLQGLKSVLNNFSSTTGQSLNNMLVQIKNNATQAATAVGGLSTGGGAPGGVATAGAGVSAGTGWLSQATQQASAAVATRMPGGITAASQYLKGTDSLGGGMVMGGLRFLRDRIGTSRNLALQTGGEMSMVARQQGPNVQIEDIMKQMSQFPGSVLGTPRDLLDLFSNAPALGASFGFGGADQGQYQGRPATQGPRAAGLLAGVRQAQMLAPGQSVGEIVGNIGGFAANTQAQQQSAFLTGGAFSMIAAGGRQKTLQEWAESVLKWLQDLRGGNKKGDPFTYGELMAQYFPGSNIDAWFQANGVPQNMRSYWWTYALQKAGAGNKEDFTIGGDEKNVAWQRLRSTSEMTRTEFSLGGQMMGSFLNKEQANRWFNQLLGQIQRVLIPAFANSPIGRMVENMPDTLEDLLMSGIEGIAAGDVSGDTAWTGTGDIGDSGGMYGGMGGTGLAGLSPNMRSKLGPMMKANPKLRVNSGLRDNAMQKRLKAAGHSRVSGQPSAHTRGDAADLGPRSQYGWIMKNASRFGLKSGKAQGEPWHVGVGDAGEDAWDKFTGVFSSLNDGASGLIDIVKWLFSNLFQKIPGLGNLGGEPKTTPSDATGSAFYDQLVDASKGGITLGGKLTGLPGGREPSGSSGGSDTIGVDQGTNRYGYVGPGPARDPGAGGGSLLSFFSQVLGQLGAPNTQANLKKLAAVAKTEGNRGGAFNPFNSTGGDFPNKFNSVGVENYPDWNTGVQYTTKLLSQGNTAAMRFNLLQEGSYQSWMNAASGFYQSWGGPRLPNISESSASEMLNHQVGAGDMEQQHLSMAPARGGNTPVQFHNTFVIQPGNSQSGGGGLDVRRTVTLVADQLEDEMNRRLARSN